MSHAIDFHPQKGYLRAELSGDRTGGNPVQDTKRAWCEIATTCQELGYDRQMVIARLTGELPTMSMYEINSTFNENGLQRNWKIAVAYLDEDTFAETQFAETVAVNRGYHAKVLDNERNAVAWLLA